MTGDVHLLVRYTGRVQGVGFRYTCAAIARRYPVAGYVKNLADRSVELVVSGRVDAVRGFLAEIAETFAGNIDESQSADVQLSEPFSWFTIRH